MSRKQNWVVATLATVGVVVAAAAWWSFATVKPGDLGSAPADALVVFGSPANIDGTPSPMQIWRVEEAVAEYKRRMAPHVIFAGGAAGNKFVEAEVMAHEAELLGIPASTIVREGHSRTTAENLRNVSQLMQDYGWTSAELISSADHVPRIAVLARQAPFRWRTHVAPTPGRGSISIACSYIAEAGVTLVLRTFGSAAEPAIHAVAVIVHAVAFFPKLILWKIRHGGAPYEPTNAAPKD